MQRRANLTYNLKTITYEATGEQEIHTYSQPIKTKTKTKIDEIFDSDKELNQPLTAEEYIQRADHCLHTSMSRTKQSVYDYARANLWEWFITITGDPTKIDRYSYEAMSKKLIKWFDNMRQRKAPDLKYVIVPERHKDGAWHFHGLLSNVGKLALKASGHKVKGMDIYNLTGWRNGFTTATQVQDTLRASNYITKYITKDLIHHTKGQKRYWNSYNLQVGAVDKDFIDAGAMELIHGLYTESAKRHKKIVVDNHDYRNEINIFTL